MARPASSLRPGGELQVLTAARGSPVATGATPAAVLFESSARLGVVLPVFAAAADPGMR